MQSLFTRFGVLPIEIRCQIWTGAFPQPRVLELERLHGKWVAVSQSLHQPASLLYVNRESRKWFLRVYDSVELLVPTESGMSKRIYYHNPAIDTLYLSTIAQLSLCAESGLEELAATSAFRKSQSLAIKWSYFDYVQIIRKFLDIKEVYVITADPLWDERGAGFVWKKVNGNIEIVEEDIRWPDDREIRIDLMITKCQKLLLNETDFQTRPILSIQKKNILRGNFAMQGTGDW